MGKTERFPRITEVAASKITEKINAGEYSTKLSPQRYKRHIIKTKEYNDYLKDRKARGLMPQSELILSYKEAKQLIIDKAGTGIVGTNKNGDILPFESITADIIIGKTWSGNKYIETNKARIYYGKKSFHIVPIGGMNYD